jgi:uncharacterized membrane protein
VKEGNRLSDHRVEGFIGGLLRIGVIVAACIVAFGGVLFLSRHASDVPNYRSFQGEPEFLKHLGNVVTSAFTLRSEAVIQLGILVLIAVPIFRVAVSIIAFLLKRDWIYCVVTFLVLMVLLFALLGGRV